MDWQPIETAPLCTTVLVWDGRDVQAATKTASFGYWWADFDLGDQENGHTMTPQPTHWMPLPEPPE